MFRWYGGLGLFMVLFAQLNFIFQVQPFAQWYFPIIWFGFIFLVDALVYHLNGESLIYSRPRIFLILLGLFERTDDGFARFQEFYDVPNTVRFMELGLAEHESSA